MSFTMFDKFGEALRGLPKGPAAALAYAIDAYGLWDELPDFSDQGEWEVPLEAMFALVREDVGNSRSARARGSKGGRPRKAHVPESSETTGVDDAKPAASPLEKQVSEPEKPTAESCGNHVPESSETTGVDDAKPNPIQSKPSQAKPSQRAKGTGARESVARHPPTPAEVGEYARQRGAPIDAERFCDYFAAQGWRLSNGNAMRDWRAAVRNWAARDAPRGGGKVVAKYAEYE